MGASSYSPHKARKLTDEQRLAWLRLIRSENVGPVTFRELINQFGGADAALKALPDLSARGGRRRKIAICPLETAERELADAKKINAQLVAMGEPGYPPRLSMIDAPPPLLYTKGREDIAGLPMVAIVGARNGSAVGKKFARTLAKELSQNGLIVASGLARGIDTEAHHASLEVGTTAVLAGGIDYIYPQENEELQKNIGERGLLISERAPGTVPKSQDFPRRNRIISGISLGVIVVEAARRSGSLITARFALEQNREVFAVPGSPLDPRAYGTNKLIKEGATLITETQDVLNMLAPIMGDDLPAKDDDFRDGEEIAPPDMFPEIDQTSRERVLSALSPTPIDIDEITRATALPARQIRVILLELDLAGRLERHGRQLVSLLGP